MTQTDLARALKAYGLPFHQQTIQRIESGERPVRLNEANLIARELGVDLTSMMESEEPTDREVRYAVDRVRRASDRASDDLGEITGAWLNEVQGFTYEVTARLSAALHPPGDLPGEPDDVSRWGLAWAHRVLLAYHQLRHAVEALNRVGTRGYASIDAETKEMINYLAVRYEMWGEKDEEIQAAYRAHPNDLYASFPNLPKPFVTREKDDAAEDETAEPGDEPQRQDE